MQPRIEPFQHNPDHKQNQAEAQASTQAREFQLITKNELEAENRAIAHALAREMYEAPGKKCTLAQIASKVRQKCDPSVGHRTVGYNFTLNAGWVYRCKKAGKWQRSSREK